MCGGLRVLHERPRLLRQLGSAEIVAQVVLARRRRAVSKVVFMGMGEPAHNLDNVLEAIQLLGTQGNICHKNSGAATGRVEIRGFGSFSAHARPPRVGRNPRTGEVIHVPEKYVLHFKPGNELRERVALRTLSS